MIYHEMIIRHIGYRKDGTMAIDRNLCHTMKLFDGVAKTLQDGAIVITRGTRIQQIRNIRAIDRYQECNKIDWQGEQTAVGLV